MDESATGLALRKIATAHRITVCAQRLADQHGFDGFTMDELAEAAEVSRRTLFNYFPGKLDAVLGPAPDIEGAPELFEEFRSGGPTGDLCTDVGALVSRVIDVKQFTRDEAEVARRVIKSTPRLLAAVHERFDEITQAFTTLLLDREGQQFGTARARLLVCLLASLYDYALTDVLEDDTGQRTMSEAFLEAMHTARTLLS